MRFLPARAVLVVFLLMACTPTYNWRDVRFAEPGLVALLPCKPDQGTRDVPLGGRAVRIAMQGCEAGGALFAVAWVDAGDAAQAQVLIDQWKTATLANLQAAAVQSEPFVPLGATALPASAWLSAEGRTADGQPTAMRAAWFTRGRHVFQAVIYAPRMPPEAVEPFFSGLRLS